MRIIARDEPSKKTNTVRRGSNFNAEYTRTFNWVMASDRGKQQASARFAVSISASLTAGLTTSVDMSHGELCHFPKNRFFKKITDFLRVVPHFFFQKLNMSAFFCLKIVFITTV